MKKVLFLNYAYPYGHFGPSSNCTVRIMTALAETEGYEVYNLSTAPKAGDASPNYKLIKGVELLSLPFPEKVTHHSYLVEHLLLFLKIPIYPFYNLRSIWKYYTASMKVLKNEHFDLVVAQCSPHESVISGVLLKKYGYINNLIVLIWDNIYGKIPRKVIPLWYALRRSRIVENWIAKYADKLVSPSPVKNFHDTYGEVANAIGKRVYLEHPSLMRPSVSPNIDTSEYINEGKINVVYAGRVYFKEHLSYCIDLFGQTSMAENLNLILFARGISESELEKISRDFKGNIVLSDWIPLDKLFAVYSKADVCIAFSGYSSSVSSKVYEYMCFGKPIALFYAADDDATRIACQPYPHFIAVDMRKGVKDNRQLFDTFIDSNLNKEIPFDKVEQLFPTATASAYVKLLDSMINK